MGAIYDITPLKVYHCKISLGMRAFIIFRDISKTELKPSKYINQHLKLKDANTWCKIRIFEAKFTVFKKDSDFSFHRK